MSGAVVHACFCLFVCLFVCLLLFGGGGSSIYVTISKCNRKIRNVCSVAGRFVTFPEMPKVSAEIITFH